MHLQDRATGGILLAASGAGIASLVVGATSKPNVGPWLALAGALLVAVLTAVFTRARQRTELDAADRRQRAALDAEDRRQHAALDAENRRHRAALAAENGRLGLQLEHDRQMSDIADLRLVLEESFRTNHKRRALVRTARARREPVPDDALQDDPLTAEGAVTLEESRQSIDALRIRLHVDDPVYQAVARLDTSLVALVRAATADQQHYEAADQAWRVAYSVAIRAAQQRVGARID